MIATDLAELLGSAIALCLLFPKLELWHGVLITTFDVVLILGMGDPLRGRPVKMFEVIIGVLVCSARNQLLLSYINKCLDSFIGYCGSRLYDHYHR